MVYLRNKSKLFCYFWDCTQVLHFGLFCWLWWLLQFFLGLLAHSSRHNGHLSYIHPFPSTLVHWILRYWCSIYLSLLHYIQFTLINGPNIPGFYAILFFIASDFTFTNKHIHNSASFLLWPSHSILFGAVSPFFPRSILYTFWPRRLIFQCHIFLPFHVAQGVLQSSILEWVAISSSSGPRFVRTLYYDPSILGGPTQHGS